MYPIQRYLGSHNENIYGSASPCYVRRDDGLIYSACCKFAESKGERNRLLARGLFMAVLFHGAYDYFIFIESYPGLAIFTLFTLVIGIKQAHKLMKYSSDLSPFKADWNDHS